MTEPAPVNGSQPMPRARFHEQHPGLFYLDPGERDELVAYLKDAGFLSKEERVQFVSRAGDGNMNWTVRVTTDHRSCIVKQSRPWVELLSELRRPSTAERLIA